MIKYFRLKQKFTQYMRMLNKS